MRRYVYKTIFFIASIALLSCQEEQKENQEVETPDVTFEKNGELLFISAEKDTLAEIAIETARSSYEQQTGLMYRDEMEADQGMLFIYEDEKPRPNFYMKDTYIPLDLIYINANHQLVDFNENAQARDETPLPSEAPAKYVLEVNAGKVEAWNLQLQDSVIIQLDE